MPKPANVPIPRPPVVAESIARISCWGDPCTAHRAAPAATGNPTASSASCQNTFASADWNNGNSDSARAGATATTGAGTGTDDWSGQGNGAHQRPARSAKANGSEDVKDTATHYRDGHTGCAADRPVTIAPAAPQPVPNAIPMSLCWGLVLVSAAILIIEIWNYIS